MEIKLLLCLASQWQSLLSINHALIFGLLTAICWARLELSTIAKRDAPLQEQLCAVIIGVLA